MNGAIQASFLRQPAESGAEPEGPRARRFASTRIGALMRRASGEEQRPGRRPPRRPARRRRGPLGVLPYALLTVAAVVGALLAGASLLIAGCIVVLAVAAIALGWRFGERGRVALEDEIEHRTSELKRALSEARDRAGRDGSAAVDGG